MYVIVAKTFYDQEKIRKVPTEIGLGEKYFAAHFPFYPLLIKLIKETNIFSSMSYLKSMVFANWLSTVFLVWFFYFLLKKFNLTKNPFLLLVIFLFLPRFYVVRSVGAPESLFIFLILLSLFFFEKERYFLAGFFGGLATLTKSPGILLFFAYGLVFLEKMIKEKKFSFSWFFISLIPLSLLGLFYFYFLRYNDFFAYFHSGDNLHLVFPFSVFDYTKTWVGTGLLEDVIFYFFLYGLTVFSLKDFKKRSFFYFSLVFFTATLFVQHRDIARYSLPLWPMALIAFEKFFTSKKFLIVFLILLLGIYFYALNFIKYNLMLIADYTSFL